MTDTKPEYWNQDLAKGAPGLALAAIEAARTGSTSWGTVNRWATAMVSDPVIADPACGLYRGAPAVAYTFHCARDPKYAPTLARLDLHIGNATRTRLDAAHRRIAAGRLPAMHEYDLISGLTGLGTYFWHRHRGGDLLRDVLLYLVRLAQPLKIYNEPMPGWWTYDSPSGKPSASWPGGHGNLGIAHGIGVI